MKQPWSQEVTVHEVLSELDSILRRVVILEEAQATVTSMWSLFSHTHDAHLHSPILSISSALPGCGKTTMATFLRHVVPNAIVTGNMSKAVVYRLINEGKVTILMDEAETYVFRDNQMRGILDMGHTPNTTVDLCVPAKNSDYAPKSFKTWAPKVLLFIGRAPHTLAERSLTIRMRRARASERPERLTPSMEADLVTLNRKLSRWAKDNVANLGDCESTIPAMLRNRVRDNWRPLFTLARAVGGPWPQRVESAARAMYTPDVQDEGELLLSAIRAIFMDGDRPSIPTSELLEALNSDDEAPWAVLNHGNGMNAMQLANLLAPFEIRSKKLWVTTGAKRGFERAAFEDAFERYLPPLPGGPEGRKADL